MKDHQYINQPTEKFILQKRDPPKSLRTQYQVQNNTQIKKNQERTKNYNEELVVKNYPKNKQPIIQQRSKFKPPKCPSCKRNNWLEIDEGYHCQNCEYFINEQKHQVDKKIRRQDHVD